MRTDELIHTLLESSDDDLSVKDLLGDEPGPPPPAAAQLRFLIDRKEKYLGLRCHKTSQFTNRLGETFIFGVFGAAKPRQVTATLAFYDSDKGWLADDYVMVRESLDDDFKDIYGDQEEPKPMLGLGTIIHATMLAEDLIPAFLDALESVDPAKAEEVRRDYAEEITNADEEFLNETLWNILQEYCPPYTYFGSNEGDGSDFGVWISREAIDDALEYEETDDLQAMIKGQPMPQGSKYVIVRDAAGDNLALLDGATGREIWSV